MSQIDDQQFVESLYPEAHAKFVAPSHEFGQGEAYVEDYWEIQPTASPGPGVQPLGVAATNAEAWTNAAEAICKGDSAPSE